MLKVTAMISLVLIATWSQADSRRHKKDASDPRDFDSGSWAASLSCDSCGSECTSACGTRHFRSCCFNYLRRKRGPDMELLSPQNVHDTKSQDQPTKKLQLPVFVVQNVPEFPEQWSSYVPSEYRPYPFDVDNRFFDI